MTHDPGATLRDLFSQLGVADVDEATAAVGRRLDRERGAARPEHRYDLVDFGIDVAEARRRLARYGDAFSIEVGADREPG